MIVYCSFHYLFSLSAIILSIVNEKPAANMTYVFGYVLYGGVGNLVYWPMVSFVKIFEHEYLRGYGSHRRLLHIYYASPQVIFISFH